MWTRSIPSCLSCVVWEQISDMFWILKSIEYLISTFKNQRICWFWIQLFEIETRIYFNVNILKIWSKNSRFGNSGCWNSNGEILIPKIPRRGNCIDRFSLVFLVSLKNIILVPFMSFGTLKFIKLHENVTKNICGEKNYDFHKRFAYKNGCIWIATIPAGHDSNINI